MSKGKNPQKRVIKTAKVSGSRDTSGNRRAKRDSKSARSASMKIPLIFNRQNYLWMGVGVLCIVLGLILMSGGASDSPDVFDKERIYSFRRITLAPFLIIVGLLVEVYAIFKK